MDLTDIEYELIFNRQGIGQYCHNLVMKISCSVTFYMYLILRYCSKYIVQNVSE